MILAILVIIFNISDIQGLTCDEILELPSRTKFTIYELRSVEPKHIADCLRQLSKEPLKIDEANYIWEKILSYYGGANRIPGEELSVLRWVTTVVKPEDIANMTLDTIEVVENFGFNYNLNRKQLAAIADRVREDFSGKGPEQFTCFDLMALNQILCQFNRSEIERIHPSAYREAATALGKLENCEDQVMAGFATLAMNETAFGPPDKWTTETKATVGAVAKYLPHELTSRSKINT